VEVTPSACASAPSGATAADGAPSKNGSLENKRPGINDTARSAPGGAEGFEELWHYYAKKEGLREAQRAYKAVLAKDVPHSLLVEAAKHWALAKGHLLDKAESQRFFPRLANWLKNEQYLERPSIPKAAAPSEPKAASSKPAAKSKAPGKKRRGGRRR